MEAPGLQEAAKLTGGRQKGSRQALPSALAQPRRAPESPDCISAESLAFLIFWNLHIFVLMLK